MEAIRKSRRKAKALSDAPGGNLIELVPEAGLVSNPETVLWAAWNKKEKELSDAPITPENQDVSENLFDTLSEWDDFLSHHTPYFREDHKPEGPAL